MKQVMMIKFDSPKWRMIDEYKAANPFIEGGFRQVKDVAVSYTHLRAHET